MNQNYCEIHSRPKVWMIATSFCPACDANPQTNLISLFQPLSAFPPPYELHFPLATWNRDRIRLIKVDDQHAYTPRYQILDSTIPKADYLFLKSPTLYNELVGILNAMGVDGKAKLL